MNTYPPSRSRWLAPRGAGRLVPLLSGAVMALVLAGCSTGTGSGPDAGTAGTTAPTGQGGLGSAPVGDQPQTAGPQGTAPAPGPSRTPSTNGGGHTATSAPEPMGPEIVSFRIKQAAKCPAGTSAYPVPAVPLVIEWKVTGVNEVTLAVDGPGAYGTYPAQGSESFTFSCGGAPGTVEKHIYTVRATANGVERSKTLTATATVNEIPQV